MNKFIIILKKKYLFLSQNGLAPLHLAAQEDHVSVAQILKSAGAKVSPLTRAGYSPLHTACHFGQINMVRYLLDLPDAPDINQRTQMGFTPLHLAAQQCHSQVVRLLLEMGADSNVRNQVGDKFFYSFNTLTVPSRHCMSFISQKFKCKQ